MMPLPQRQDAFANMPIHRRILLVFVLFAPFPALLLAGMGALQVTQMAAESMEFTGEIRRTLAEANLEEDTAAAIESEMDAYAQHVRQRRHVTTMTLGAASVVFLIISLMLGILLSRQVKLYFEGMSQGWNAAMTPPQIAGALEQLAGMIRSGSPTESPPAGPDDGA